MEVNSFCVADFLTKKIADAVMLLRIAALFS